ncbi:MAG: nicotinate-nucleotide--dimethylbenzimidazole phosphoribosyltransferase [Patescibacteria group bacterium]
MNILELIQEIKPVDSSYSEKIKNKLDNLTKPLGSLGVLEDFVIKLGNIQNTELPNIDKKRVYVFAGDHGIAAEGVSAYPPSVTPQMVLNFINGGAAINVLARHFDIEIKVVDVGVNFDFNNNVKIINKKIASGTKNFLYESAMTKDQAIAALLIGFELAQQAKEDGVGIIVAGDMGIGNTTPSSAITSLICDLEIEDVTGNGTGISSDRLKNKIKIIKNAIKARKVDKNDPIDILQKVGGFEIGAIAGLALGCAYYKLALVADGFISTTGIALANKINPIVKQIVFPSHSSVEKGHKALLKSLDLQPVLNLNMRLGEGTGGVLAISLIEAALDLYKNMATFKNAGVDERIIN